VGVDGTVPRGEPD
jgi:hypothetical protein